MAFGIVNLVACIVLEIGWMEIGWAGLQAKIWPDDVGVTEGRRARMLAFEGATQV
jgi:hypothetical protein